MENWGPGHWDHVHLAAEGWVVKGPAVVSQGQIMEAAFPLGEKLRELLEDDPLFKHLFKHLFRETDTPEE